jgi:Caspase domain
VIGNARYAAVPLNNPENDARLVSAQLRKLGFEVTEKLNLGVRDFRRVLRDYARRVQDERGVSVLYYAGHGVQIDGRNFLLPVDINLRDEEEVKDESVDVDELFLSRIEKSGAAARIVILDACRDNPFGAKTRNIRAAGGLAEMAARGALIAYSSAPGAAAEDGPAGTNSIYTKHLADEMMKEGIEVEQMFKNVRVKVLRDTNERQVPWVNTSLTVNFSFNPALSAPVAGDDAAQRERIARLEAELDQTRRALEAARISAAVESAPPGAGVPKDASTAAPTASTATTAAAASAPSAPTGVVATAALPPANANTNRLEAELERARKALEEARSDSRVTNTATRSRNEAAARPGAEPRSEPAADARRRGQRESSARCLDLLQRSSIGDMLSADDETYLVRECK